MLPYKYAKKLGVSNQVIRNWIDRKKIEYRKIEELDLILVGVGTEKIKGRNRYSDNK
jgi:hypothetical protein